MQSTKSWVVRYFQKHETVKFSLLLRFDSDMKKKKKKKKKNDLFTT